MAINSRAGRGDLVGSDLDNTDAGSSMSSLVLAAYNVKVFFSLCPFNFIVFFIANPKILRLLNPDSNPPQEKIRIRNRLRMSGLFLFLNSNYVRRAYDKVWTSTSSKFVHSAIANSCM